MLTKGTDLSRIHICQSLFDNAGKLSHSQFANPILFQFETSLDCLSLNCNAVFCSLGFCSSLQLRFPRSAVIWGWELGSFSLIKIHLNLKLCCTPESRWNLLNSLKGKNNWEKNHKTIECELCVMYRVTYSVAFGGHLRDVGSNPFRGNNTTEDLRQIKKLIIDTA